MKDFMRVLSYAGDKKPLMTKAVVLLTFSVLFSVAPFLIVGIAINSFFSETTPQLWWLLCLTGGICICLMLKNFLNSAGLDASHRLAYYTLAGMRRRVADKMLKMSMDDINDFAPAPQRKTLLKTSKKWS